MKLQNCIYSIIVAFSTFLIFTSVAKADTTSDVTSLTDSNNIAIAYNDGDASSETDTKTSNVNVTVISGTLTLDAVPSFNFENAQAGTSVNLKDNSTDGDVVVDGNSKGILKVTDSRKNSPGFILSARLNSFSNSDNDFTMTLNSQELYDDSGDNISNSSNDLTTEKAKLTAGSNQNTEVMNLASGSYQSGTITTSFTSPDSASLYVPNSADNSNTSSVKKYSSTITWTLTPNPATTK